MIRQEQEDAEKFQLPLINSPYIRAWMNDLGIDSNHVWSRFGAGFCNGIDGWIFTDEDIRAAADNGRLMHLDFEFGQNCSLNCIYCFRTADLRDGEKNATMTFSQWEDVLDQASDLGLSSIKLLGQGELTENRDFLRAIEAIHQRGIKTLLFTAAHILGDDIQCQRIHGMDGDALCQRLYELNASVMVKVNSFEPALQDSIVACPGYTVKRNLGLKRLLHAGFADHNPTRLGLEVAMMKTSKDELEDIYNLKFHYNVYIDLDPFMPCGLTKEPGGLDFELSYSDKMELYRRVYANNIRFGVPFRGISPYAGGQVCSQLGFGLYVNLYGKAYPCPGSHQELGNIYGQSLKEIFDANAFRRNYAGRLDHGCPFREESGILHPGWEGELQQALAPLIQHPHLFQLKLEE